jgi:hypothetical protein
VQPPLECCSSRLLSSLYCARRVRRNLIQAACQSTLQESLIAVSRAGWPLRPVFHVGVFRKRQHPGPSASPGPADDNANSGTALQDPSRFAPLFRYYVSP